MSEIKDQVKIIAKTAWNFEQAEDKLNRGADGLEVQLLSLNDGFFKDTDISFSEHIDAIHMLLMKGDPYTLKTKEGRDLLPEVCKRASLIGERHNKDIVVVTHTNMSIALARQLNIYDDVISVLRNCAKLPNITIAVENTTEPEANNGIMDYLSFAKAADRENVGVCLDTCHAFITEKVDPKYPLKRHFAEASSFIKWIHLCNAIGSGENYGKGKNHGVLFCKDDAEDMQKLDNIYELYRYFRINCPLCLEVQEEDYYNCVNFTKTREAILTIPTKTHHG